jgi:MOSC domain-containing protein YiiM
MEKKMAENVCAVVASIQVGMPRSYGFEGAVETHDRPWTTGFFKEGVAGPVFVGRNNIAGDGQADLTVHGGPDKAVMVYSANHYAAWRAELGMADLPHGGFGENLTIDGQTEETVCIGDIYAIGAARFEVSQPRGPCWKLARRWRRNDLIGRVIANGRTGWYLRVLEEGAIEAGNAVMLLERPSPEWSIARAHAIQYFHREDARLTAALAAVPALAEAWKDELKDRLERMGGDKTEST